MNFHASAMRTGLLALVLVAGCAERRNLQVETPPDVTSVDEVPSIPDGQIVHHDALGSAESSRAFFLGLWLPASLVLEMATLGTLEHRRRAQRETDAAEGAPWRDGPTVVQGRVETDGGDAITVTVTQRKRVVKGKNQTYVYWDEKRRDVVARPFRVRTEEGRVVEVIPDNGVHLRDELESPERVDDETRLRRVRLRPGEVIWVS